MIVALIRRRRARDGARGFTLIEVAIAMAIVGVGVVTVLEIFNAALRTERGAGMRTRAAVRARDILERTITMPEPALPLVPLYVNVYLPPQPTPRRCYAWGRALRAILDARPERVALMASGGLSHYPGTDRYASPDFDILMLRSSRARVRTIWRKMVRAISVERVSRPLRTTATPGLAVRPHRRGRPPFKSGDSSSLISAIGMILLGPPVVWAKRTRR